MCAERANKMKKENAYKFLYAVCVMLIVGFCIRLGVDFLKYNNTLSSAPFYVFIIVMTLEFIVPCIIIFAAAKILRKKYG